MEGEMCAYCFQPIRNGEGYAGFKGGGCKEMRYFHRRRDDDRRIDCWDKFLMENQTLKVIEKKLGGME